MPEKTPPMPAAVALIAVGTVLCITAVWMLTPIGGVFAIGAVAIAAGWQLR